MNNKIYNKIIDKYLNLVLEQDSSNNLKDKIIKFFKENPNPSDDQVHKFAEKEGINPHDLESAIYQILTDKLKDEKLTNECKLKEQEDSPNPDDKGFDVRNIEEETTSNTNFRKVLYTGSNLQLVLMSLKPNEDIGMEVHSNVDQFFRIDDGSGFLEIKDKGKYPIKDGTSIVIKAGTNHNIMAGNNGLKLYTVYAPPNHPPDRLQKTKAEAIAAEKNK